MNLEKEFKEATDVRTYVKQATHEELKEFVVRLWLEYQKVYGYGMELSEASKEILKKHSELQVAYLSQNIVLEILLDECKDSR